MESEPTPTLSESALELPMGAGTLQPDRLGGIGHVVRATHGSRQ